MTTQHLTELAHVVHQTASILVSLEYIDQAVAQSLGEVAEAVTNAFMVVYYQAETGKATEDDFQEAIEAVRQSLTS